MIDFPGKRPSEIPIVVLDTETTGLYPAMGHRVVELGAVRFENWQEVGQINTLLSPSRKMDSDASRVNGITDRDLLGKPSFADVATELFALLDGALLVAHNARFDAGFLAMELYIQAVQARRQPIKLENPWLCTLELARAYFRFGRNNLQNIARVLNVRVEQAHRALADVYTTAEIFKRMTQELARRNLQMVDDLLLAQGYPIFAPEYGEILLPDPLETALQNGRSLLIEYESQRGTSRRKITPRYATQYKGATYLVAYCYISNDQRTFRLDRIVNAKLTSST